MDKKIEVGVDSHPRDNVVSTEELQQIIRDLVGWFKDNASEAHKQLQKGGEESDLKQLREGVNLKELQQGLEQLIKASNGGFQLHDSFKSLSVEQIIEENEINAVSGFWKNNYLTFAKDLESNYLILETDTGKILSWNNDEGIQEQINENIGLYLEKLRNGVLKKELEYIEEVGLVENQG